MDSVINSLEFLQNQGGQGDQLQNWEVVFSLILCWALITCICLVYRYTHRTPGYSQSYVQTLVLTGMVTTLIMIVIGSNIARAFSLVGALSIIRFRNAVKETRDIGFIFFSMAIAMACGTRFYLAGTAACGIILTVNLILFWLDFGARRGPTERLLSVQLPPSNDPDKTLNDSMVQLFSSYSLLSVESVKQGMYLEARYSVVPKPQVSSGDVFDQLSSVNNNLKIVYHCSDNTELL